MSFRIPHRLLTETHKTQIVRDLTIKEQKSFNFNQKQKLREIRFFSTDGDDILLPMNYASKFFNKPFPNSIRSYPRVPPFEFKTKLYDYQEEVVHISLQNFMQRGSTFLNVFCAFGKTVVAAYFAAVFAHQQGLITLITYPRTLIGSSWVGTFQEYTGAKIYEIGVTPGEPDDDVQVFLCMDTRLSSLDKSIRQRIGHFVIDEADRYCTSGHIEGLLSIEPLFVTLLTATYERDDGFHKMLDLIAGSDRITRISKKPFYVFHRATEFEADPRVGPRGIIFDDLVEQLDNNEERNTLIVQTVIDNINEKILILTKHVPHAEQLTKWLTVYLKPYGKTVALLAGKVKKYNDASVIVGTISKVGVGFDEKKACIDWKGQRINMLILASSTKKIEQIAGRVFRADIPIIVDIVDNNKNVKAHWGQRKKWYESRNGQIYSVNDRFCWQLWKDQLIQQYFGSLNSTSAPPTAGAEGAENRGATPTRFTEPKDALIDDHVARLMASLTIQ